MAKFLTRLSYLKAVNAALDSRNDVDSITCFFYECYSFFLIRLEYIYELTQNDVELF